MYILFKQKLFSEKGLLTYISPIQQLFAIPKSL